MTFQDGVRTEQMICFRMTLLATALLFSFAGTGSAGVTEQNEVVILLHGLGRTDRSMAKMADNLQKAGYAVENIGYPSTRLSIGQISDQYLVPTVQRASKKYEKIHIVSHSMGGIVIRQYLADNGPDKIRRVVMLAPPNHGSEVIDNLRKIGLMKSVLGPGADQLSTAADSLPNTLPPLNCEDCQVGIIAGTRSYNPLFSYWVKGKDDGKVSVQSTTLEGMSDHLVVKANHSFIMRNKNVIEQTIYFLSAGRFRTD
ncbi:lipase family alpha/beta hydrolase [Desulfosediminicola sp.]|uniref:lipase family alpha/beta hydrolase n=1 Tax=Desulfosediminicola sp. TaxID=2886825 RepID=UPI003AF21E99